MKTGYLPSLVLCLVLMAGCARVDRKGILSQDLPLTLDDLSEIRAGELNHERVLEDFEVMESPKLERYLNEIARNVAMVSTRPSLPYKVIVLDDSEVNMFGGPGGFIYMTRGLLDFVGSESEIAGLIAHEIGHISHHDYSNIPHVSKMQKVHGALLKGTDLARNSVGTYGTAAYYTVKYSGKVAPYLGKRFDSDSEIVADEHAIKYLLDAGYDPRGLQTFMERLARVPMEDVGKFVILMNVHPPFQDRRALLEERLAKLPVQTGSLEYKPDLLSESRQAAVNDVTESIVFDPKRGTRPLSPLALGNLGRGDSVKSFNDASRG